MFKSLRVELYRLRTRTPCCLRGDLAVRDRGAVSDHRERGLADGEQWVAHCPIRIESGLMARCVPPAPQGPDSADSLLGLREYSNERARHWNARGN